MQRLVLPPKNIPTRISTIVDVATAHSFLLSSALVAILVFIVYSPALHYGFINYDDIDYVTSNAFVQKGISLEGIVWSFSSKLTGNWHPLTWMSHMLDVELFGLNPTGHHLTSLLLHIANSLLLLRILVELTNMYGRSLLVAMLFALHPLHVESVVWVAERKDVLSTLFLMLTIWSYIRYSYNQRLVNYLAAFLFFCLGIMCKQMLVTVPIMLLLLDYWPLERTIHRRGFSDTDGITKKLIFEKIPFMVVSMLSASVVFYTQRSIGAINQLGVDSVAINIGNALISYIRYMGKMFYPVDLAVIYPFDPTEVTITKVTASIIVLTAITAVCILHKRRRPYFLFGWFWFLITLLPVIGIVRIGMLAYADRYSYIPLIGLFIVVVWALAEIVSNSGQMKLLAVLASVVCVVLLSCVTRVQLTYWKNDIDLFRHAIAVTKNNWVAHNNLAMDLVRTRTDDEAAWHFKEAVRINKDYFEAYRNLGQLYIVIGKVPEGITYLRQAVQIKPDFEDALILLGYAYLSIGNAKMAYAEYEQLNKVNGDLARLLYDTIESYRAKAISTPAP
jgi:Tfp pilus assembly protein PilF